MAKKKANVESGERRKLRRTTRHKIAAVGWYLQPAYTHESESPIAHSGGDNIDNGGAGVAAV